MKIVDERKNKGVEGNWNVGDVIEYGDKLNDLKLGMIIQHDVLDYGFIDLQTGSMGNTRVYCDDDLNLVIRGIKAAYEIARKVNVELHIKEGE